MIEIELKSLSEHIDDAMVNSFCNKDYEDINEDIMVDYISDMLIERQKKDTTDVNRIMESIDKYKKNNQKQIKSAVFINQIK